MDLDGRCQAASRSTAGRLTVYSRVMTSLSAERCFLSFFWGFVDSAIGAGEQREVVRDKIPGSHGKKTTALVVMALTSRRWATPVRSECPGVGLSA
jgi:hypothetical protein